MTTRESRIGRGRRWLARAIGALVIVLMLVAAGVAIHLAGIRLVGSVEAWRDWQDRHRVVFVGWRLMVYAITARGWWWMRERLFHREPSIEARQRLRRVEVAAIVAIVLLEGSPLWQHL